MGSVLETYGIIIYKQLDNKFGFACHMVWYIQYLWWCVVEWVKIK